MVDDEDILSATSLNLAVFNGGRVLGPAVAGVIIEHAGIGQALYLNAFLYAVSALFLLMMTGLRSRVESSDTNIVRDVAAGVRYVASTPVAFVLVGLGFAFGFFGSSYIQVLPAFGKEVFSLSADGVGLLLTVAGVGSLVGNLFLAVLGNPQYKNWLLLGMIILFGVTLFALRRIASLHRVARAAVSHGSRVHRLFLAWHDGAAANHSGRASRGRMMSLWLIGAAMHYVGALPLGAVGEYWGWPVSLGGSALVMMVVRALAGHSQADAAGAEGLGQLWLYAVLRQAQDERMELNCRFTMAVRRLP